MASWHGRSRPSPEVNASKGSPFPRSTVPPLSSQATSSERKEDHAGADLCHAEHRNFPGLNHWDPVWRTEVREVISSFLQRH